MKVPILGAAIVKANVEIVASSKLCLDMQRLVHVTNEMH
jgi:hypothetical protein